MISVRSTAKESPEVLLLSLPMSYLRAASFFCRCLGTPQLGLTTIQQGCCFLFLRPILLTHYHSCKLCKLFYACFTNMSVVNRVKNGKTCSAITVCVITKLVFHLVTLKIGLFAKLNNSIFCHCSVPHKAASCS